MVLAFAYAWLVMRFLVKAGRQVRDAQVVPGAGILISVLLYMFAVAHIVAGIGVAMTDVGTWQVAAVGVFMGLFYVALAGTRPISRQLMRFAPHKAAS